MTCRSTYDTDLTDPEWEHLKPLAPVMKAGGRPPIQSRREILNGIFYAVRRMCLEATAA
jgi:putative transposase